ncbi:MAG: hypothetical protein AAB583_03525 [Patescibacteria group bacterium]
MHEVLVARSYVDNGNVGSVGIEAAYRPNLLEDVIEACYTEHRVVALNNYFAEQGKTASSAYKLVGELEERLEGPVAPPDIYLPSKIADNTLAVRRYLKDSFRTLREELELITDPQDLCDRVFQFTKTHHKHIAWAHAQNGLFADNEGMNVRLRQVNTLDNIDDVQYWFEELGVRESDIVTQKHILSKTDRQNLVNPLLGYGLQTIERVTPDGVNLGLTEQMYVDALLAAGSIIKNSKRNIPAQVSGDTWTLDPNNFRPVVKKDGSFYDDPEKYPDGKPFASFKFVLKEDIAGPSHTRRRIGTAACDGKYSNQWNFAAADPRRKAILESPEVGYDLGVYGQIRLKLEFVQAMERLAAQQGRSL